MIFLTQSIRSRYVWQSLPETALSQGRCLVSRHVGPVEPCAPAPAAGRLWYRPP